MLDPNSGSTFCRTHGVMITDDVREANERERKLLHDARECALSAEGERDALKAEVKELKVQLESAKNARNAEYVDVPAPLIATEGILPFVQDWAKTRRAACPTIVIDSDDLIWNPERGQYLCKRWEEINGS